MDDSKNTKKRLYALVGSKFLVFTFLYWGYFTFVELRESYTFPVILGISCFTSGVIFGKEYWKYKSQKQDVE